MAGVAELSGLIFDRLSGQPFGVFRDGAPARPPGAYVLLYFAGGNLRPERLASAFTDLRWTFRAMCVGYSDEQALATVDAVRDLLAGWRPVTEQSAGQLNEVANNPPLLRDGTGTDIRSSITLLYRVAVSRS